MNGGLNVVLLELMRVYCLNARISSVSVEEYSGSSYLDKLQRYPHKSELWVKGRRKTFVRIKFKKQWFLPVPCKLSLKVYFQLDFLRLWQ